MTHKHLSDAKFERVQFKRAEHCCRPMIYNDGSGELIETWRGGTCFVIKWVYGLRKRYFVITALHVLTNRFSNIIDSNSLDKIKILKRRNRTHSRLLTGDDWVSIIAYHPIPNPKDLIEIFDDADVSDVAIFETEPNAFDGEKDVYKINPKNIGYTNSQVEEEKNIQNSFNFFVIGYPEAVNTIDHDNESIILAPKGLICKRAHPKDNGALTEIKVVSPCPSPYPLNGYSGSPVFSGYNGQTKLCGMVLRGGGTHNDVVRFLRISSIIPLLFSIALSTEKTMRGEFRRRGVKFL
ncbi:hypothetical protein HLH36_18580 [Gluconacetobacter aggeris]|uniref:Trypsin-like peptidase n=1 Tax=Gluconacetobacter aggeris TaxID=1286186 RepID=A0A7W4P063_9PROT|nr:hypothetical protein [Gluconacetobacter aggeris]MBB2170323.1 hypothetical protein [Gluconacetobacter aggeris]